MASFRSILHPSSLTFSFCGCLPGRKGQGPSQELSGSELVRSCSSCWTTRVAPLHALEAGRPVRLSVLVARPDSQSVSHYHTPSREHMAHTQHSTLVFFFQVCGGYLCIFQCIFKCIFQCIFQCISSSFFWKVVVLQDGLLLLSLFTYLLVESGPR